MKHTECIDCELGKGDCGYHFKMDGVTNYDIASLSACDQYGNCMFFKSKAKPQGDLIRREDLKKDFKSRLALCNEWIEKAKDKETKIRASAVKAFIAEVIMTIDNAPEVELANHLRDRIKDIDHEITIPQSYEAKCFLDGKRKAFQYVLDLLENEGGAE